MPLKIVERVERYAPLSDIQVRSEGDGRTIEAYASVFDTPQEIRDRDGHYEEIIDRGAFDKTLAERADRLQVMFNHGKTMWGTPSERFSMPIGTPVEVKVDGSGLFTRSRVAKTDLGDEVLALVNDGAIRGMSFSGGFLQTRDERPAQRGGLPVKVRTEISLREYGPTPFPAYDAARITGVRHEALELFSSLSTEEIVEYVSDLPDDARSDLLQALTALAPSGMGNDESPSGHLGDSPTRIAERRAVLRAFQMEDLS